MEKIKNGFQLFVLLLLTLSIFLTDKTSEWNNRIIQLLERLRIRWVVLLCIAHVCASVAIAILSVKLWDNSLLIAFACALTSFATAVKTLRVADLLKTKINERLVRELEKIFE